MSLDRLTTRGAWTPPYLISPPNERGHGEPIMPALDDVALRALLPEAELGAAVKVARWQNLIPFFPWIAPGWRGVGAQSKERKGSKFAAQRSGAIVLQARRA